MKNSMKNKIKKEIRKKERRAGRRLSEKGRRRVAKSVVRRTKIRNRIVSILAALGITVGGVQALLPEGNNIHTQKDNTNIQMQDKENSIENKRETYLSELSVDVSKENAETLEKGKDSKIIEKILEAYNDNLLEQAEIGKEDLGIILQNNMGEGNIIRDVSSGEKVSYIENISKSTYDLEEGQKWVDADSIDDIYVLVDTEHNNTIAGIGSINGNYQEIDVEKVKGGKDNIEYVKNDRTYVGLPEEVDKDEAYESFSNYYQERTEKQQKTEIDNDAR